MDGVSPSATFIVRPPNPALSPYVQELSAYTELVSTVAAQEQPPTAAIVPMILVLGPGWDYEANGEHHRLGTSFVAGLRTSPVTMHSQGYAVCMQVNFTLLGARRFLGIDMHELTEEIVDLADLVGQRCAALEHRLLGHNDWASRFDHLESALMDRILGDDKSGRRSSAAVQTSLAAVERSPTDQTVNDLARSAGVSRKHLVTLFAREVGLSPKQFLQLKRFEEALQLMQTNPDMPLSEVAYTSGFADQAHLTRQFRRYMGRSPSAYQQESGGD